MPWDLAAVGGTGFIIWLPGLGVVLFIVVRFGLIPEWLAGEIFEWSVVLCLWFLFAPYIAIVLAVLYEMLRDLFVGVMSLVRRRRH